MKAIVQHTYGCADVLELRDIDRPAIADEDVLIRVHAAGVDRGVWHLMTGLPYPLRLAGYGLRAPRVPVPGMDVAGVVQAVGRHVTRFRPGDAVFGIGTGCFAEYARARADHLAAKPADLTFEQAAVLAISGLTALHSLRDHAHVEPGQTVLVIGASGGVVSYAVQLAKAFGTYVTGVCSSPKLGFVRSLGADHVIDYTRHDFADGTRCYDAILDIGGNSSLTRLRRALIPTAAPGDAAVPVRAAEPASAHPEREPPGHGRAHRAHRGREGHAHDRPALSAKRCARGHSPRGAGTCSRKGRHHRLQRLCSCFYGSRSPS